jgi:hypothetical protein
MANLCVFAFLAAILWKRLALSFGSAAPKKEPILCVPQKMNIVN